MNQAEQKKLLLKYRKTPLKADIEKFNRAWVNLQSDMGLKQFREFLRAART